MTVITVFVQKSWKNIWVSRPSKKLAADDNAAFVCFLCDDSLGNYTKYRKQSEEYLKAFSSSTSIKKPTKKQMPPPKKEEFKKESSSPKKRAAPPSNIKSPAKVPEKKPKASPKASPSPKKNATVQSSKKTRKDYFTSSDDAEEQDDFLKPDPEEIAKVYLTSYLKKADKLHQKTTVYKNLMKSLK